MKKGTIFILAGCVLLIYAGGSYLYSEFTRSQMIAEFLEETDREREQEGWESGQTGSKERGKGNDSTPTANEDEQQVIALMKIPTIALECPVLDGMDASSLKSALGHEISSAYPGEPGNVVISGHRAFSYGVLFDRLNEVAAGDQIELITAARTYYYQVKETFEVLPEDVWVMEQTQDHLLTLITCTPKYIASHRLIIRCELQQTDEG